MAGMEWLGGVTGLSRSDARQRSVNASGAPSIAQRLFELRGSINRLWPA
jgi:hypothetical protein